MIKRYVNANALHATEPYLLVPVPADDRTAETFGGFAQQVFERYPRTALQYHAIGGVALGNVRLMDARSARPEPLPPYTLAFAATHLREQSGWLDAPEHLADALRFMHEHRRVAELAVAGSPGGGLSGLRDEADLARIQDVLRDTPINISVYDRNGFAGNRAEIFASLPPRQDVMRLDEPAAV